MALEHLRSEMLAWEDALSANDSGDFRGSLRLFQPIASTSKIFVNTALIHDRLGERPEAIESFTKAIELDEYLAIGYFQRGVSYFHGERYPEAAKDFSDAETMMRTNPYIDYKPVGLDYRLELTEVLFNKWLALSKMGQTESAMVFQKLIETSPSPELRAVIENAMKNSEERCTPCSLPVGTLYRPSASTLKFLSSAGQSKIDSPAPSARRPLSSLPSLRTASSDTASTVVPSVSSRKGHRKQKSSTSSSYKGSPLSNDFPQMSSAVYAPKRGELNRVIGADMTEPMIAIHSIPCAGVRITHGPLTGLMAFRFFVQLDGSIPKSKLPASTRPGVITNFIFDTGSENSYVTAEALTALNYRGKMIPGAEVTLLVQSVKTKCVVAHPGEAGRVGLSFMNAGSLSYYFDPEIVAPVLYDGSAERPAHVPRTIRAEDMPGRSWLVALKHRILSIITFSSA